ncbi:hypothetical protein CPter291_3532 [Collimonas pratensis]|uniref:Uncharacterized protein n=2 Tax=Collimonas pratensis TaxID=279113 RepID=A0ABM5Z9E4_9BURK|nr:hypothetical protein CPter291_3532 [Collimonas pratensis]
MNAVTQQGLLSAVEPNNIVNKPTTQKQVLENMKFALDHDLLLREDFYSDENLKNFFDAKDVRRYIVGANHKDFRVQTNNFEKLFKPVEFDGNTYPGAQMAGGFAISETGELHGSINIDVSGVEQAPRELYFNDVENVFGKNWELINEVRLHGPLPYATGPHGNETIRYTLDDTLIKRGIVVEFHRNGSFAGVYLTEERK